jgi:hypothetical protein
MEPASAMAEASLLGMAAAVSVPLVYAGMLSRGRRLPWPLVAAVASYLCVAGSLSVLHGNGLWVNLGIAAFTVLAGSLIAEKTRIAAELCGSLAPSRKRCLILRTAVPVAYLLAVTALRELAGARWAGLLSTFPGMSLALLVVTHLEAGPAEAVRMAKVLPPANLGTIAFIVAFRYGCPELGLVWGIMTGYALAVAVLPTVSLLTQRARRDIAEWNGGVIRFDSAPKFKRTATEICRTAWLGRARPKTRRRRATPLNRLSLGVEPIWL